MNFSESLEKLTTLVTGDLADLRQLLVALLIGLVILVFFIYLSRWIKKLVRNRLDKRTEDSLLSSFIAGSIRLVILLFGITLVLRFLGLTGIVSGILAGAGITAFIIGFALKDIGENFLAGILLAFKRPFKIGDLVEIQGLSGKVRALNLRDTQIKTLDGKDVFLPNASIIKSPLINYTIDGYLSYGFTVGLGYGCDYRKAQELIIHTLKGVAGVLSGQKESSALVTDMGDSHLLVRVTYWVNTYNKKYPDVLVRSQAILAVLEALEDAGFPLPGNIIELKGPTPVGGESVGK
ncbi:mechanosensitive ion channel family protein [Cyclobacterium jeungdonense]|uniref:Mechanosensitive ion channel family protein n=1 Tax=Cyclobacterium jeungdonense TaxID=708087 RepID=A0ABT8C9K9_9BACT|nr:mechanosensitive ion channel family protein [Cyclobacterium jeungdonense]MDN3688351.1 mechanosensitive ion channel family protein [Cyclobacterium jeungdonense]